MFKELLFDDLIVSILYEHLLNYETVPQRLKYNRIFRSFQSIHLICLKINATYISRRFQTTKFDYATIMRGVMPNEGIPPRKCIISDNELNRKGPTCCVMWYG